MNEDDVGPGYDTPCSYTPGWRNMFFWSTYPSKLSKLARSHRNTPYFSKSLEFELTVPWIRHTFTPTLDNNTHTHTHIYIYTHIILLYTIDIFFIHML